MAELVLSPSFPASHRLTQRVSREARRCQASLALIALTLLGTPPARASEAFRLPTNNRSLLQTGREGTFFAPTPGRTWTAGQFGCVRSEGTQMHEGIDILSIAKDKKGEPTDEVRAAAAGQVAYISRKAGLSNYGVYVVLRHRIEGLQAFTLYAHLREVRPNLAPGTAVRAGEAIGTVGRTTNTRTPITRDRAHLHFEIDLLVNESFSSWLKKNEPGTRDDHGPWNGRNLLGLDPAEIYRQQEKRGEAFSLLDFLRNQREMCRILVPHTSFPWLKRYPSLIRRNPVAEREGIVAYEISWNYNGVPFRLVPRARSEIKGSLTTRVLDVDESEFANHRCRKLIFKRGQIWTLTARGQELLQLLTH